ncbi:glycoside hydrolase family 2 TIM barrel-domain containing protein [Phytoactinopolyspora limicola]|uniref:glycoside hydrolase family 2 TIM barrel-domain containing protein n=1 Tax=Phytoactinopolyspora limicola TaxID=2715536 RepID=UPI00140B05B0|nr:glycoside hydrolase family 2 TIM barrel-domain containing protein [Phytoactinopolyspora limicola]
MPHDWRIAQPPAQDGPVWQAFSPNGVAYYRLTLPPLEWLERTRTVVEFEGVMRDATLWCNGFLVDDHLSGYTSMLFDLTELLRYGDEGSNVLLIRCDTTTPEGWWYEGGGIYRDVWLIRHPDVHVDYDGVYVTTADVSGEVAAIRIVTAVRNQTTEDVTVPVMTRVNNDAPSTQVVMVRAGDTAEVVADAKVVSPTLWDIAQGNLYSVTCEVGFDRVETSFGIRTIEVRAGEGVFLNGERVRFQGANLHQDFAGLGIALPNRVVEHKLELLQQMGCNAVRIAHHPPSRVFLDVADRLGMLVIVENRLLSTARPYLDDLIQTVRRYRNHPSVWAWSLENEELLEDTVQGTRILRRLVNLVRRVDSTRPTMVGADGLNCYSIRTGYFDAVDVVGVHYRALNSTMGDLHASLPKAVVLADEDGLFPTVRGQYEDDEIHGWASSFGTRMGQYAVLRELHAERSGRALPDYDLGATWQWFVDHPESGGGFVWSGMDYFGEPTPIRWPVTLASYGAMDVCGFPKDYYWLLRSFFRPEPLVHVLPHWTWPGHEGRPIRLWIYSNCDEVELLVNGSSLGVRQVENHIVRWDEGIVYRPGILTALGRQDGEITAKFDSHTAGHPVSLRATVDRSVIEGDGRDVALVSLTVEDAEGRFCPWADDDVHFEVEGPAEVIGVGNGDPTSLEAHVGDRRRAFRGRCLAIVRATGVGSVNVHATAHGLVRGTASFEAVLS